MKILTRDGIVEMNDYEYYCHKYGKDKVDSWINNVTPKQLWDCLDAFSNSSFNSFDDWKIHRDKDINMLEMILQETPDHLYASVTYGVCPGAICTDAIGKITNRKYGNIDIAIFLIQYKIKNLKSWLLENHKFTPREKRLLHYDFGGR